jgi:hypothetical protein
MTPKQIKVVLEYMWKKQGLFHSCYKTCVREGRKNLIIERGELYDARRENKRESEKVSKRK